MGNNSNWTHIEIKWDQPTIVQSGYTNLTAIIVKVQSFTADPGRYPGINDWHPRYFIREN